MINAKKLTNILKKLLMDSHPYPFVVGEKVVAVDAIEGSGIKNNSLYTVIDCNKYENSGEYYWYVQVKNKYFVSNRVRPSIFRPLTDAEKQPFVLKLIYGED